MDTFCTTNIQCNAAITCSECRQQGFELQLLGASGPTLQSLMQTVVDNSVVLAKTDVNKCFNELKAINCAKFQLVT